VPRHQFGAGRCGGVIATIWTKSTSQPDQVTAPFAQVSYSDYPDFATDAHPALRRSIKLSVRTREIDCFDYTACTNPPILRCKETLLTIEHPIHAKIARLSQQEEKRGLLDDAATLGTKEGWQARLDVTGFVLRGHRPVRR
jgi:DNA phosphorothioation-associated putative methyltransferase